MGLVSQCVVVKELTHIPRNNLSLEKLLRRECQVQLVTDETIIRDYMRKLGIWTRINRKQLT